jgi:hypothetical protein
MLKSSDANHILQESDVFSRFLKKLEIKYVNGKPFFLPDIFYKPHERGFSVFRTNGEKDIDIWNTAIVVYTKTANRLGGRFELTKNQYENAGLTIELNETTPKHYDIFGFPLIDSDEGGEPLAKGQALVEQAQTFPYEKELYHV